MYDVSAGQLRAKLKSLDIGSFFICEGGLMRPLATDDFAFLDEIKRRAGRPDTEAE
jgi:hypothetical protein